MYVFDFEMALLIYYPAVCQSFVLLYCSYNSTKQLNVKHLNQVKEYVYMYIVYFLA